MTLGPWGIRQRLLTQMLSMRLLRGGRTNDVSEGLEFPRSPLLDACVKFRDTLTDTP